MKKIAVIGAGLSGLTCAHFLKDHAMVTLFEKARGPSGRISTRRALPYIFDHGAQYFTARRTFSKFYQPFIETDWLNVGKRVIRNLMVSISSPSGLGK